MEHAEEESRTNKQDDEESIARLEELKRMIEVKMALRQSNLNPNRPDSSFLRTLDSSIKRNTAVIRKLKQISEDQKDALIEDLKSVNLSKFVSEAVSYICEAKLKTSDIQAAVQVCSLLHQRYKDFSPCLIQGLLKVFSPGKTGEELDNSSRAIKRRSTLKLLMELYFVGIVEDATTFINIIKDLTSTEYLKDREATQTNLSLLTSFAKQGRYLLGLPVPEGDVHEEFFKGLNVTADQKKFFKKAFSSYHDAVVELLHSEHHSLRLLELENAKVFNARGELSEDSTASYEKQRKSYDQLLRNVSSLAEALEMDPPVMPDDGPTRVTTVADGSSHGQGKEAPAMEPVWDDEDTRAFYESLPDLRAFVPAVLLGEAEPKTSDPEGKSNERPESPKESDDTRANATSSSTSEHHQNGKAEEKGKEKEERQKEKDREKEKGKVTEKDKTKEKDTDRKGEIEKEKGRGADNASLDALLQRLPSCVSRDLIDQLTVEFCYLNSKATRKRLVRALFGVPRTSLELLPYYSRMVATLATCMRDVPAMLVNMLEEEFNFLINKKDQINIETKIKNIRFIGELCKFKIAPSGLVFTCFKQCLDDFTHHNIDVACNLLETCGRFLYRSPETTVRMANMLDVMMRLKIIKNLDPRHSTLVENAYYLCKPPEKSARVSKVRPPLHQYIKKLIFTDLDKNNAEYILRQLRKMPWADSEQYILKCFLKVHKGKYSHIYLIALLTAGLSRYHDDFAVAVVDEVLEEIRVGLELNEFNMQQMRLAHMRFLGELYNFEQLDSSIVFETLYLILIFGHGTPEQDVLDPPEDCFRIRMVITLLRTCGHYFNRGSSKRKLDRFLLHFQRYILSKGQVPFDIEFEIQDMLAELRPKMTRYTSLDDITTALVELEEKERLAKNAASGVEENGTGHARRATPGESDSCSDRSSIKEEDELLSDGNDEGSDSEDGDDEDEDAGPARSEEDEVAVRKKRAEVDPAEMEDFDRELKAMMQESLESRKQELRVRPATLNMMIPMNLFEGGHRESESGEETLDEEPDKVRVKVLVKKGNKQQTKQMYIPGECSLVQGVKEKEAAEMEEKRDIKKKILEYNEREEDEGSASLPTNWPSLGSGGNSAGSGGSGNIGSGSRSGGQGKPRSFYVAGGYHHGYGRRR
ncbi:Regulator of nonsense transcripts 2 [Rhynchospora pubera]|uniref:Regulator of nonsense transcripts 2 n=2 Tax=Rhynchospora pubera TaxID=906938 RepID=A0AAV8H840_9POAL|nr:Regulator of nonsense transcripts 2 [Rhynchospora pubera]